MRRLRREDEVGVLFVRTVAGRIAIQRRMQGGDLTIKAGLLGL
jgi:hypothetical protein